MHEKVHCRIKREKHWRKQMIRILILSSEFPNSLQQNAYFAFNRKWSTSVKFLTRISSWGKNGERRTQNKNSDKCTLSWHEPFQIYTHYLLLPLRFYINQIFTKVKKKKKKIISINSFVLKQCFRHLHFKGVKNWFYLINSILFNTFLYHFRIFSPMCACVC